MSYSFLDRYSGEVVNVREDDPDRRGDEERQDAADSPCVLCRGKGYRRVIWCGRDETRPCVDCGGCGVRR